MDEPTLSLSIVLQHLQVALIPWLIVLLAGGGLMVLLANPMRRWAGAHPRAARSLTLLPWRSAAIWAALVILHSPWMTFSFGLGTFSASLALGAAVALVMLPWLVSTTLRSWDITGAREKGFTNPKAFVWENLLTVVRLSAILSIALVVLLQAGMGYFIWRASAMNDFAKMLQGYALVGVMMLVVDLIFGLVQRALFPRPAASGA